MSNKDSKAKVAKAFRAMKDIGISEAMVKPVLKDLLKLYDKNWALIEEENYRALADAIFERDEAEADKHSKKIVNDKKEDHVEEEAQAIEEAERPLKRLRLKHRDGQTSTLNTSNSNVSKTPLLKPKDEPEELPETCPQRVNTSKTTVESQPSPENNRVKSPAVRCQSLDKNKGKKPVSPKSVIATEGCDQSLPRDLGRSQANTPVVIESLPPSHQMKLRDRGKGTVSTPIQSRENRFGPESSSRSICPKNSNVEPVVVLSTKQKSTANLARTQPKDEPITDGIFLLYDVPIDVVHPDLSNKGDLSSRNGTMRKNGTLGPSVSLSISEKETADGTDFTYELRNNGSDRSPESPETTDLIPTDDCQFNTEVSPPLRLLLPPPCKFTNDGPRSKKMDGGDGRRTNRENNGNCAEERNNMSLVVVEQHQVTREIIQLLPDVVDIAKGQEKVVITLVNEVNNEHVPAFCYIPQNALYRNACMNFSLACIGDESCCSTCLGDCLSPSTPCACTRETGGGFAYTADNLVKEEFLEECISLNRDPKKKRLFFCKECPLARSQCEDIAEYCKGHPVRKFIKECWWKCGCHKQCGNRVTQRGITRSLQVFMTPEGKGWGLRTLEDLPKGAFVCEYVGEVVTIAELFDRVLRSTRGEYSSPLLLDADWGAERVLKDEEALCLDATYYGNVARFVNHRCYDANLVEIPVEMEIRCHHYYHLAFFTTRKVNAMEELTWDYGINFEDHDHPFKPFICHCGSKFCRNLKRSRSITARR